MCVQCVQCAYISGCMCVSVGHVCLILGEVRFGASMEKKYPDHKLCEQQPDRLTKVDLLKRNGKCGGCQLGGLWGLIPFSPHASSQSSNALNCFQSDGNC